MIPAQPHRLRIAVVGGGIAGLTFALAAHRAGLAATVYERSRQPRDGAAGLQLSPNAVRSLTRLGAGPGLRSVATRPGELDFRHWRDGAELLRAPIRPAYAERFGAEHHTLLRTDLRELLSGLLPAGTVRYGAPCVGLHEHADAVRVDFADGTCTSADIAVGADGAHSRIVARAHPDHPPRHSGMDAYRAVVPIGADPRATPDRAIRVWVGDDRHFLAYPVAGGRRLNLVLVAPADPAAGPDERWGGPVEAEPVARALADWDPAVPALLRAGAVLHRRPLFDRDPLPAWSTARTTLIGDAAHPMLPHQAQGACQAVEDAVVLATLLAHAEHLGVAEALRRYAAHRAPRTARIQGASREFGTLMHSVAGAELLAELAPDALFALLAETYGYDAEAQALAVASAST
ncbi:FAD-dependent monooxygenase [Embleya sp. AB8]|uniref:FAD-dependent monooxygenase n=1 Tax=Embleya sp. AB8 TaxID=3156304 RepID=UPI003C765186